MYGTYGTDVMEKMVTVRDIARVSGVSPATVSRTLSGKGNVNAETRRKVIFAARQLGYSKPIPELPGDGDTWQRHVAVVFPRDRSFYQNKSSGLEVGWCFDEDVFDGIEQIARQTDYELQLIICTYDDESSQLPSSLYTDNLCGYIVVGGVMPDHVMKVLMARNLPIVTVGIAYSPDIDAVVADNLRGMKEVIGHMFEAGARRIGLLNGPKNSETSKDKLAGYYLAHGEQEVGIAEELVKHGDFSFQSGYTLALELLEEGVDGIACAYDAMALGALQAIMEKGLQVPRDILLAGYGNEISNISLSPTITTVAVPKQVMGKVAFERLIQQVTQGPCTPVRITLPTEMVPRQSTERAQARKCG